MTKLLQSMVLLLAALMVPAVAATALAQGAQDVPRADSMYYTPVWSNLVVNHWAGSAQVKVPAIGPSVMLEKDNVRIELNHQMILDVGFFNSSSGAPELKVMSSDNTVATARVENGKVLISALKEGTAIITVAAVQEGYSPYACTVTVYTRNGDVNCDGEVSINDLTGLIGYLLGSEEESFKAGNADVNGDGEIAISDVTYLIDHLLHGNELYHPGALVFSIFDEVEFKMIAVEGGTFTMGATAEQGSDADDDEKPTRQITLSSYYIGETEVTQALWNRVKGYSQSYFVSFRGYSNSPQRPVESVSWEDCLAFITRLNNLTGYTFRLPTEAEWEFAARGGNKSRGYKYSGSNDIDDVAWTWDNIPSQDSGNENYATQPVATKSPNELGLYDMSGNVWEWCQDWYCGYDLEAAAIGQDALSKRVARGGDWRDAPTSSRLSSRIGLDQWQSFDSVGLRLVLDVDGHADFRLSESAVTVSLGESKSVDILNGHETYSVYGGGGCATGVVDGHSLVVNGDAVGTTVLFVVDNATGIVSSIKVYVTNQGRPFTVNGVTFMMMPVDGGTFTMGASDPKDYTSSYYETPAHQVTLTDYLIGQTEMTQELWQAVMSYNPSHYSSSYRYLDDLNRPVENISLEECLEFIARLNDLTGKNFRLPAEAEWEFAARGGNKSLGNLYAGSNDMNEVGWYYKNSHYSTHPVATKAPNELGLYDMSGNVWEQCLDWFDHYTSDAQTNPAGPLSGEYEIIRGGSYDNSVPVTDRGHSYGWASGQRVDFLGFRLALDVDDSPKFRLSQSVVKLAFGESRSVNVLNGHGDYTVTVSRGDDRVDLEVDNDCLTINARSIGSSKVYITDNATGSTSILNVLVTAADEQTFSANGVPFKMVAVDGGTFTMGATAEQGYDANSNEKPTHQVTLTGYSIGQTEVTQELWRAVMGSNPSYFGPATGYEFNAFAPVERVSWYDCQEFIAKLNQITGRTFRLPTEAEWEFAARGGNKGQGYKYSGSDAIGQVAWFSDEVSSNSSTQAVARKAHNELGLFDMSGNVWEWCQDWYGSYSADALTDPTGPSSGTSRVIRGGSWGNYADYCRVSFRSRNRPTNAYNYLGLRLVLDEDQSPKFGLSETVIKLSVGVSKEVYILNGHGDYTVATGDQNVDVILNGNCMTVTGQAVGSTTVYVTDNGTGMTAVLNVIVSEIRTFTVGGVDFNMVTVESGTFTMGGTAEQDTSAHEEMPTHQVTLTSYSIGQTEVTQELWQAVMACNPSTCVIDFNYENHLQRPVDSVSWDDCQAFIAKLNQMTGMTFRLPTEAEWEYAARGGSKSQGYMYSGGDYLPVVGWFEYNSETYYNNFTVYTGTHVVGSLTPNELGLYDMSGNVMEWCQDWFGPYGSEAQNNPTGPSTGDNRIARGGSFLHWDGFCRVSFRGGFEPAVAHKSMGLRLAL